MFRGMGNAMFLAYFPCQDISHVIAISPVVNCFGIPPISADQIDTWDVSISPPAPLISHRRIHHQVKVSLHEAGNTADMTDFPPHGMTRTSPGNYIFPILFPLISPKGLPSNARRVLIGGPGA